MPHIPSKESLDMLGPVIRYLDGLPETAPGGQDTQVSLPENVHEQAQNEYTPQFRVPDSPSYTSSRETTAQPPSQSAETGLLDESVDTIDHQPTSQPPQAGLPVTRWTRQKLTSTANTHYHQLRELKPKPQPEKPKITVPKPKPKRKRKKSTFEATLKKTKRPKTQLLSPPEDTSPSASEPVATHRDEVSPKTLMKPRVSKPASKRKAKDLGSHKKTTYRTLLPKPPKEAAPPMVQEDEVSPKTARPKRPKLKLKLPAPKPETPKESPAKKRRKTGTSRPKLVSSPEIEIEKVPLPEGLDKNPPWSAIEPLLPGSLFGSGTAIKDLNLWNEEDESRLRNLWSAAEESTLVRGCTKREEVMTAVAMKRIYDCRLQDLFRYGLRRPMDGGSQQFWLSLHRLLPHPYFHGDVAHLRFSLQQAVIRRIGYDNHTSALCPPWSHHEPGYITHLKELLNRYPAGVSGWHRKNREITEVAEFRCRMQVISHFTAGFTTDGQSKHDLNSVMNARKAQESYIPPPVSETELWLFYLTTEDILFLSSCLDEMDTRDIAIQNSNADHHWKTRHPPDSPLTQAQQHELEEDIWEEQNSTGWWDIGDTPTDFEREHILPPDYSGPRPTKWGVHVVSVTVHSAFTDYWTPLSPTSRGVTPASQTAYLDEKRLEILASRREYLIRRRIDPHWSTNPAVELLDITPFDPNPDFKLFTQLVNPYNLHVVRGLRPTPEMMDWLNLFGTYFSYAPPPPTPDFDPEADGVSDDRVLRLFGGADPRRSAIQGNCRSCRSEGVRATVARIMAGAERVVEQHRREEGDGGEGGSQKVIVVLPADKTQCIPLPDVYVADTPEGPLHERRKPKPRKKTDGCRACDGGWDCSWHNYRE
jgi:hypothetical protein